MIELFPLLHKYLLPSLVDTESLEIIRSKVANIPPVSGGIFECRLGYENCLTDLNVCIRAVDRHMVNPSFQHPAVADFFKDWGATSIPLLNAIEIVWLEFDTIYNQTDSCPPSIFFNAPKRSNTKQINQEIQLITYLYEKLNKVFFSSSFRDHYLLCKNSLPPHAFTAFVGLMLSRNENGFRLNFRGMCSETLSQYLRQIRWKGETKELDNFLNLLKDDLGCLTLALDVGNEISLRIGIECYLKPKKTWEEILNKLACLGLCKEEKRAAVLNWSGQHFEYDDTIHWPHSLRGISNTIFRWVNHLKIVYIPGQPLTMKAYLAFGHCNRFPRI